MALVDIAAHLGDQIAPKPQFGGMNRHFPAYGKIFLGRFSLLLGKAGLSAVLVLFAIYIGNVSTLFTPRWSHFIFLYADDIILLAPATELERLLHISEKELEWLDMSINF